MNWLLCISCVLTLLLTASLPSQTQHTLETLHLIERGVKEKEPTCRLAHISVRKNQEENYAYLIWRCDEQDVRVDVNEYASVEEVKITPNSLITADARTITRLRGIGDEAFLLGEGHYSKGNFNLIFRKGKVLIDVTAPSAIMAQRFGTHLADSLPVAQERMQSQREWHNFN